ncbi:M48 family metallopeptidase [Chitinophaga sp. Cy-1792]|uniref:M48 family metallopeptidase n=1 Tax=Chitinophaga sp. Cy-1792 TaxID=2608339 RepID=UPI00141E0934|nr:M48 family metallopeptidase [Chitinophaga sp. Cy-1792]NIG57337.1 M48 family metallopeptidase [Chitinophaga sp. Cy-1792]
MKKIALFFTVASLMYGCGKAPITGRKQLLLFPESTMESMALTEYQTFLTSNKVVSQTTSKDADMVKRVGQRIAAAVTNYMNQQGNGASVSNYKWEFNLVDSKEVNAWCMPGGKVVVYTGLLPVTQNETALAVVMGHEIAHAIAQHGNERMSQQAALQGIQVAGAVALGKNPAAVNLFNQAIGVGGNVGILAFSRTDEMEADHLGIIFMALAGYNPQEAIPFWQRMAAMSANTSKPPEFLSTHPSDERRIQALQGLMPEAMKYYKPVGKS